MTTRHFSLFLALRYLRPKRTFLSIITLISVLGVTLGVMVLILVISVMTGFERELERKVVGFDAHVVITSVGPKAGLLTNWEAMQQKVLEQKDVVASAPFVQGPVLVEFNNRRMSPKIRAVDPDSERKVIDVPIKVGAYDLEGDKVILGSELAYQLGANLGDSITVYSPENLKEIFSELDRLEKDGTKADAAALKQMLLPITLEVTGIFETGRYIYDSDFMMVPLHVGQEIYGLGGDVHGLAIRTSDKYLATSVADILNNNQLLGPTAYAQTWMDLNKQIFDAIKMERNVMFVLLFFIILVAAFGIMNTLITVTVQKTREIGIMKALGAQTWQIIGVFMAQGVVVGVFGTVTGLIAGISLVQFRNEVSAWLATTLGIEVFPRAVYQFSEIPAEIVPGDVVLICVVAFLICSLAALIPAWFAARLDPVKALRYE